MVRLDFSLRPTSPLRIHQKQGENVARQLRWKIGFNFLRFDLPHEKRNLKIGRVEHYSFSQYLHTGNHAIRGFRRAAAWNGEFGHVNL